MGVLQRVRDAVGAVKPNRGFERGIVANLEEIAADGGNRWVSQVERRQAPAFDKLLALEPSEQRDAVLVALRTHREAEARARRRVPVNVVRVTSYDDYLFASVCSDVAKELLRRRLPWDEPTLRELLRLLLKDRLHLNADYSGVGPILRAVEQFAGEGQPAPQSLHESLRDVRRLLDTQPSAADRKAMRRVDVLIGAQQPAELLPDSRDAWAQTLRDAAEQDLPGKQRPVAKQLMELAATATGSKPTTGFKTGRDSLIEQAGRDAVAAITAELLERCAGAVPISRAGQQLPPETGDVVRGLCWIAGALDEPATARALGGWAVLGWQKVPGHGPFSRKAASAAIGCLPELPRHGAAQLGRVRSQLKQASAIAEVDKAIDRAAERIGIGRDEFEERVVPHFALDGGARTEQLGDTAVRLELGHDLKATLAFTNAKGKPVKSAPAALKRDSADELKALKVEAKDITVMAGAQRLRLERLLMHERAWELDAWRSRYLDHGLVSVLARRLIWTFTDDERQVSGIWHDGEIVGSDGQPLTHSTTATIGLWHPVDAEPDEVHAWRRFVEDRQIVQPFKQAHREVYLLTDAEVTTRVYSNRFAAHVLRQHQFAALARGRGWSYALQGAFDSPDEHATLQLPAFDLTATFWVDRPWDSEDWNDAGIFNHVLTDQVRFLDDHDQPVQLTQVPVRVLSEVLRDVDLFVGVASIGNDPAWQDRGADQRYNRYWSDYSFGELGEAAKVRRDLLERLLPKLKIAAVSRLDDRFLVVEGQLRTYRIHLGSGNIQMEPNNQYLCIVPGRGAGNSDVFLPFDGDQVLSIILSKAMMLAKDTDITDTTITSQIKRRR